VASVPPAFSCLCVLRIRKGERALIAPFESTGQSGLVGHNESIAARLVLGPLAIQQSS